ncbi:MAG: zinc ribbon domain-containing protein [Ruminococcaceae bacterium]|nr:zinc ribbon domain-containing protein [Oscillospiraceae bacterium]
MKYCQKCGKELVDEAVICIGCGCAVAKDTISNQSNDAPDSGYAIISFLIPIIGLILYITKKDTMPLKAASAGKGALSGFITWLVLYFLIFFISVL